MRSDKTEVSVLENHVKCQCELVFLDTKIMFYLQVLKIKGRCTLPCKAKQRQLFTLQVSSYCCLALQIAGGRGQTCHPSEG